MRKRSRIGLKKPSNGTFLFLFPANKKNFTPASTFPTRRNRLVLGIVINISMAHICIQQLRCQALKSFRNLHNNDTFHSDLIQSEANEGVFNGGKKVDPQGRDGGSVVTAQRMSDKQEGRVWLPGTGGAPDDWTDQSCHLGILSRPSFPFGFASNQLSLTMVKTGRNSTLEVLEGPRRRRGRQ